MNFIFFPNYFKLKVKTQNFQTPRSVDRQLRGIAFCFFESPTFFFFLVLGIEPVAFLYAGGKYSTTVPEPQLSSRIHILNKSRVGLPQLAFPNRVES